MYDLIRILIDYISSITILKILRMKFSVKLILPNVFTEGGKMCIKESFFKHSSNKSIASLNLFSVNQHVWLDFYRP